MIQLLEFTALQANIMAVLLPIISVCLFILIIPAMKNGSGSKVRRYISYLINPPKLSDTAPKEGVDSLWRRNKVRLFFYYLGAILFLTIFMIGEFYEVMIDLLLPVQQGITGNMREITNVAFQSLFNAGWIGSLPWIGLISYHETWNWVYFTAAFTDNVDFLGTMNAFLILFSIVVGLVYLAPLVIKTIRHSFLPSMFYFLTGMTIFTKAAISSLAYATVIAFGSLKLDYLSVVATGSMIPGLPFAIAILTLIVLAMFGFFMILGRRLWRIYYPDSESRKWFMLYVAVSFWLGFVFSILVV